MAATQASVPGCRLEPIPLVLAVEQDVFYGFQGFRGFFPAGLGQLNFFLSPLRPSAWIPGLSFWKGPTSWLFFSDLSNCGHDDLPFVNQQLILYTM